MVDRRVLISHPAVATHLSERRNAITHTPVPLDGPRSWERPVPHAVGAFICRRSSATLLRQIYSQYVTPAEALERGIIDGPHFAMKPSTRFELMVTNLHTIFSEHICHHHFGVANREHPTLPGLAYLLYLDDCCLNPDSAPIIVLPGHYILHSDFHAEAAFRGRYFALDHRRSARAVRGEGWHELRSLAHSPCYFSRRLGPPISVGCHELSHRKL